MTLTPTKIIWRRLKMDERALSWRSRRQTCLSATFSTINPTWNGIAWNRASAKRGRLLTACVTAWLRFIVAIYEYNHHVINITTNSNSSSSSSACHFHFSSSRARRLRHVPSIVSLLAIYCRYFYNRHFQLLLTLYTQFWSWFPVN
jgi:hypothetical protein